MPVPFAPWRDDLDQEEADDEDARGPIFFDPSLNMSEAWRPPRPPKHSADPDTEAVDRATGSSGS